MSPLNVYSQKILSLEKVTMTSFHINTMVRELEENLGKYRKGESEMLKPDVGVYPLDIIIHFRIVCIYICNNIQ